MTNAQILEALAGKEDLPQVKAMMAVLDGCIELIRQKGEEVGLDTIRRSECSGGARVLRAMKTELQTQWLPPLPLESA